MKLQESTVTIPCIFAVFKCRHYPVKIAAELYIPTTRTSHEPRIAYTHHAHEARARTTQRHHSLNGSQGRHHAGFWAMFHVRCFVATQLTEVFLVEKRKSAIPSPEEPLTLPFNVKSIDADSCVVALDAAIGAMLTTVNMPSLMGGPARPQTRSKLSNPSSENPPTPNTQASP